MRKEQLFIPVLRQVIKRPRLANMIFGHVDSWGNPFSDAVIEDPMTVAGPMRADGPVHWHPFYQQWFVMGYDEAREALGSPHVGTQQQMTVLLDVSPFNKLSPRTRTLLGNLLLFTDPPMHTRLRSLVSRAFTPRQVSRLEPRMVKLVDDLLEKFDDDVELMSEFAIQFPAMVITELVGFDPGQWGWLQEISKSLAKVADPIRSFDPAELDAATDDLYAHTVELTNERRERPTEDVLSALALAEDDGDRLSEEELVAMVALIMIAGHETTSGMIGLSVMHLREHPEQLRLLEKQPDLWPNAIEELLRYDPTFRNDPRTALENFELAGHKIKKGQNIVILPQLANRDLRRSADADEFRVDREDPSPISFGHGIHYCLGASLARAELAIALPRLIDKLQDYDVDRKNITWRESISLRGPAVFNVRRVSTTNS